ncbi:hypothetical protein A4X17_05965 [Plantibacter sp. H53]|nr:hypothetical protein A4X17_05965 [Plantibacter sp. H53]
MPDQILASARAQFPKSANKRIIVRAAFRPEDSSTGEAGPGGSDGWTSFVEPATYEVISKLRAEGFTIVNLETGGTANPYRDVAISRLI